MDCQPKKDAPAPRGSKVDILDTYSSSFSFTTHYRRTENSLKIWVFEVKGLSDAKKYFCEIHVDDKIYARTSSKKMKTTCFWGEYFGFLSLPKKAEKVTTLSDNQHSP